MNRKLTLIILCVAALGLGAVTYAVDPPTTAKANCPLSTFQQLSPADAASSVKTRLQSAYYADSLNLTQKRVMLRVINFIDASQYGTNGIAGVSPEDQQTAIDLQAEAAAAFTREQNLNYFGVDTGDPDDPDNIQGSCNCSQGSEYNRSCYKLTRERTAQYVACNGGTYNWCNQSSWGCGFVGWYRCDGKCSTL